MIVAPGATAFTRLPRSNYSSARVPVRLTKDFATPSASVRKRIRLSGGLLREGLALCHAGDFATGRGILRNYVNATIGFARLSGDAYLVAQPAAHV